MNLIQNVFYALVVLSTLSGVTSAPTNIQHNTGIQPALDDTLSALKQRDSPLLPATDSAVASLTSTDPNTSSLAPRSGPPTDQDFVNFFKAKQRTLATDKLVFWSGVGIDESQNFARATAAKPWR